MSKENKRLELEMSAGVDAGTDHAENGCCAVTGAERVLML
jgi:hypothetical protein